MLPDNSFSPFSTEMEFFCIIQFIMLPNPAKLSMKYINPLRLKVLMMMFLGTGILGIIIGLEVAPNFSRDSSLLITFMGVINLSLGGFFGWIYLTQKPQEETGKRKPKRK